MIIPADLCAMAEVWGKMTMRQIITDYIKDKYDVLPEYPWAKYDSNAVFRHKENRKWFALIMDVRRDKVGLDEEGCVPVINLKIDDPALRDMLVHEKGIMPAYHMSKAHWITVLLDGTVSEEEVCNLLEISYQATSYLKARHKQRAPKEWIIPANTKYYDIIHAFDDKDEIDWKQGSGINAGDTVFIYVGSPVSAIMYKCRVTKTDIPFDYHDGNLTIRSLMSIRLIKRYDPSQFTFDVLRDEYGIYAIRGPRGIPNSLGSAL